MCVTFSMEQALEEVINIQGKNIRQKTHTQPFQCVQGSKNS